MADNNWQALAITHKMEVAANFTGEEPDVSPTYADAVGYKGQRVFGEMTKGGLFIPPGDAIGQFVKVTGLMLSTGPTALGGLTWTIKVVALPLAGGMGEAMLDNLWKEQSVAGSAGYVMPEDQSIILPPHTGIKIETAGVAAGQQVSATVIFEKYRDAVASIPI